MKHTLFILALITASIQTFAQSPRIKLNQITKDSLAGSVMISSPTDSGMVYSRDLFISYGADTFLILGGDTLAATSSIISSVLSDGVTITGDGTLGSELTADTSVLATLRALSDSLALVISSVTADNVTITGDGTVGSPLTVDTATVVATKGDLSDYVNISGTQTITGAKTFTSALTQSVGDVNFDSGTFFVDESTNRVGIGSSSPSGNLEVNTGSGVAYFTRTAGDNGTINPAIGFATASTNTRIYSYGDLQFWIAAVGGTANSKMTLESGGNVGIGTTTPSEKLDVDGKVKIGDLTGTGGNAVYENGGVLGVASDSRFKSYIGDINNGIQKVLDLKPKYFVDNRNSTFQQLGFYAQEVKSVINEASYPIGNTDYLGINDRAIIAVTVKAIQEQQAIIESIQTELQAKSYIIESQATEIETLKSQIQLILQEIEQLKNN